MDIGPFDQAQIAHNVQYGYGIWDTLKSAAKGALRDIAKEGVKLAVSKGSELLQDKITGMIDSKMSDAPTEGAGLGIRRKRRGIKGQQGEGFFDDLWGGVKEVGKVALPILGNVGLARAGMPPMFSMGGMGAKRGAKRGGMIGIYRTTPMRGSSFKMP